MLPFTFCPNKYKLLFNITQMFLHIAALAFYWSRICFVCLGFPLLLDSKLPHFCHYIVSVNAFFANNLSFGGVIPLVKASCSMITRSELNIFMVLDRYCHIIVHMVVLIEPVIDTVWVNFRDLNCPCVESFPPPSQAILGVPCSKSLWLIEPCFFHCNSSQLWCDKWLKLNVPLIVYL